MIGCYDKIPEESNSKGVLTSASFRVQSVVAGMPISRSMAAGHIAFPVRKQRERNAAAHSYSLQPEPPRWMALPTFRVILLEMPHRCGQRCVSLG